MGTEGPQVDNLITGTLVYPMLNEYFRSLGHRAEMVAVAEEIKRRYLAKLAKHNKTGKLASTARVTTHRSRDFPDRRWESEFTVGGRGADYADDLEREYHLLASVLNEMGFFQGDSGGTGPTGVVQKEDREPKRAAPHREPPDRKPIYRMTDAEQREERARSQREYAAANQPDETQLASRAAAERAQDEADINEAIADLERRRVGSGAESKAFSALNRIRFLMDDGEAKQRAKDALDARRAARVERGLDPQPKGTSRAPDEK